MSDHQQADDALADAIWWFRGFKASQPDNGCDQTYSMDVDLLKARLWIKGLAKATTRRIGLNDEEGVAITYGELERMFDALREAATDGDRWDGREAVKKILAEYQAERSRKVAF